MSDVVKKPGRKRVYLPCKRSPRADPDFKPSMGVPPAFVDPRHPREMRAVRTGPRVPAVPRVPTVPAVLDGMPPPPLPSPELAGKSLSERLTERISVPTVAAEPEIVVE